MKSLITNVLLALLVFASSQTMAARVTNPTKVPKNAVLLSKVSSLTLRADKKTSSRRVSAVPQLSCVGPADVCKLYRVDVMRCTNEGTDYDAENVQWSCKANLPDEFKLGSTEVVCEGYESSDDPYVLKGSCGVEYRLLLTDKGEEKYRSKQKPMGWGNLWGSEEPATMTGSTSKKDTAENIAGMLFFIIFAAVAAIILYGFCTQWNSPNRQRRPPRNPYGGYGGGGNDDDPPPPYDDQSYPKKKSTPRTYTPRSSSTRTNRNQTQDGWRPGMWTGAAAGAAAGYMAGRAGRSAPTQQQPPETQQRRGLFSWGSPSANTAPRQPASPPAAGPSSWGSTPSYSSTQHESTGFGSTRRR